jgi:uncharacterized protein YcsI (UPF0317 family)
VPELGRKPRFYAMAIRGPHFIFIQPRNSPRLFIDVVANNTSVPTFWGCGVVEALVFHLHEWGVAASSFIPSTPLVV